MFSGIIEGQGRVVAISGEGQGRRLTIECPFEVAPPGEAGVGRRDRERVGLGDSIAVNGACLTVDSLSPPRRFSVVAGRETLERTTIGGMAVGSRVNLERALRMGDRLDGHIVSGHVDGLGEVREHRASAESIIIWVTLPAALMRYAAEKGSVTIDGVSLTINELSADALRVNIIPHTARETTLGGLRAGAPVNIEVDLLARYIERLLGPGSSGGLTAQRLQELGYGRSRGGSHGI
jgi:riboflavin synthase